VPLQEAELSLCRQNKDGSGDNCQVPQLSSSSTFDPWEHDDWAWYAKVERRGVRRPVYRRVIRRTHTEIADLLVGTVRWRWQADDETIWAFCPEGCCEILQD